MNRPSKWARMDWPLLLNAVALCAIGILNVYSGTRVHGVPGIALVWKQLAWILLGVGAFFSVYLLSDGFIEDAVNGFFLVVILLLVAVLLAGRVRGGAQRWIAIGAFNFQPSEFAKIAVTLVLARYFSSQYRYGGIGLKEFFPAIGLVLAPFLLVALQPDLGSAGVFLFILAGMAV
ncbi:MAG: rod shape-determining protein RodA, partial [Deltaproteobacteria bacterium CG_4_9_14_3_um_filter_65_9]